MRLDHPALAAARARGVAVRSEIDLAGERTSAPIVAITGTNGKTTVTTLVAAMLSASGLPRGRGRQHRPAADRRRRRRGRRARRRGLVVPARVLRDLPPARRGRARDHPRPPRLARRLRAATSPPRRASRGTRRRRRARVRRRRSRRHRDRGGEHRAHGRIRAPVDGARVRARGRRRGCVDADGDEHRARSPTCDRALVHDRTNALAAGLAALEVGATTAGCAPRWRSYATLPHRVALVGKAGGVYWYDDSKATNPDATLRALESFDSVVLLAGGRNKGLDLVGARARRRRVLRGVVAFGEAGARGRRRVRRDGARGRPRLDARRRARRGRARAAGRRGAAVARVRVVRRVRELRRAGRRLRRRGRRADRRKEHRRDRDRPRACAFPRFERRSPFARVARRDRAPAPGAAAAADVRGPVRDGRRCSTSSGW